MTAGATCHLCERRNGMNGPMQTLLGAAMLVCGATLALAQGVPGLHFIENWDLDGDGKVTLAEAQERRGDVFTTFDADEDGALSAEEYVFFDEARANDMGAGPGNRTLQRAEAGMALSFNDTDGDGRVSREEFLANTAGWIARIDTNQDGVVTTGDFSPRG